MSYVAAVLLMIIPDEETAFWCLVSLLTSPNYLQGYYDRKLVRVQKDSDLFWGLVVHRLPKVAKHMRKWGMHPLMYTPQWFMCVFTALPTWDTVLASFDMLCLDGK